MDTELCQALRSEQLYINAGVSCPFSINQMYWAGNSELCCNLTWRHVRSNITNSFWQYAALSTHLHLDAGDIFSRINESDEEETPSGVESSAAVWVTRPHSVVVVASTEDAPGCSYRHTGTTSTTFTDCCMPSKRPSMKNVCYHQLMSQLLYHSCGNKTHYSRKTLFKCHLLMFLCQWYVRHWYSCIVTMTHCHNSDRKEH